jgi:cytosine permease
MSDTAREDYATAPVPRDARRPMAEVLFIRLGAFACVPQLLLGASLGYGLTFREAVWATVFGSVILQVLSWALGAAACAEGLSTTLLARWAGFGRVGSAIVGAVIAIALTGWFGVQNGVFANGLFQATGLFNVPLWAVLTGLLVTWITVKGYRLISLIAKVALPLFLLAVGWAAIRLMSGHSVAELMQAMPAGRHLGLPEAITAVTGSFIIGAIVTPDVSRFMRGPRDVFWMTLIATFVGELSINLLAVAMALLLRTADIVTLMATLAGGLGATIAVISTVKLNNLNLYSSSLGFSTLVHALQIRGGERLTRARITWWVGIVSTLLSTLGILDHFIGFLILLGVAIPPVAGIMIVDYYVLRRDRVALAAARAGGHLPTDSERINPVAMIAWVCACASALLLPNIGIPALNSLVIGSLVYWAVMRAVAWRRGVALARFARVASR